MGKKAAAGAATASAEDSQPPDFSAKLLHLAWHPGSHNLIAAAASAPCAFPPWIATETECRTHGLQVHVPKAHQTRVIADQGAFSSRFLISGASLTETNPFTDCQSNKSSVRNWHPVSDSLHSHTSSCATAGNSLYMYCAK